jgi:uncharacterized protein YjbI with pentapeptide repeats
MFERTAFSGEADFHEATFKEESWFSNSTFTCDAAFREATFNGVAWFLGVKFNRNAWFFRSTFKDFANFEHATFGSVLGFTNAFFYRNANFASAVFNGDAEFQGVITKDALFNFEMAFFKKNLIIQISSETGCSLASFSFDSSRIIGDLSIEDSEIERIKADNLIYQRVLSLRNIVIRNNDIMRPSSFENVYLERAKFINIDLSTVAMGGPFIREVIFDRISFGKPTTPGWQCSSLLLGRPNEAIFEERYVRYYKKEKERGEENEEEEGEEQKETGQTSGLDESRFWDRIILWFGRFPGAFGLRWLGRLIIKIRKKRDNFCAAETVYRTLKHEMEKQHAMGLARRMRAGEMECKLHGESNIFQKVFLFGYRFLNGFGLRWIRAFVFWCICILSFAWWGYYNQPATFEVYREATSVENEKVVKDQRIVPQPTMMNFNDAVWHSLEMTSVIARPSKQLQNPEIRWLEGLEKILSPALFFLFLQAARNAIRD